MVALSVNLVVVVVVMVVFLVVVVVAFGDRCGMEGQGK